MCMVGSEANKYFNAFKTKHNMAFLCDYMLNSVQKKLKALPLLAPTLRRQIAGNLDNPYDMDDSRNLDIKLFVQDYVLQHGIDPPSSVLDKVAIFPPEENLQTVQHYLQELSHNLSKL